MKSEENWSIDECPECGIGLRITNNKVARHERRLAYIPYRLYKRIEEITGSSIKEQMKLNLCPGSGTTL